MTDEITFIHPTYRRMNAIPLLICGVQFSTYRTGILRYAWISDDGQIIITNRGSRGPYSARIIGHGPILGAGGKPKRFRTQSAAAIAAVFKLEEIRK